MAPGPVPTSVPALDGVRVLDFASVGPAARASRMLADYGATVVKIGPTPKDGGVQIVPPFYAYSGHRGMQRALIDLKATEGREAFLRMATSADVIIESFRPGVVDRLGVGFGNVKAVNPRIVYCSTSGYGQTGPYRDWAAHDVNYLALGGFLDCTGRRPDGSPPLPGATVADIAAGGMQATLAIMAALLRRGKTGEGEHLDVSIADGVMAMMSLFVDEYLATGTEPGPGHYILTGRYACYDVYRCRDDRYLSVGAIEPQFWRNLCLALDLEQYAGHQMDDDRQDEIRSAFADRFSTRDRDAWAAELGPADCCVAPVLTVAEAVVDPHYAARGVIADAVHETEGAFRQAAPIWAGTTRPHGPYAVRDATVTDTDELLRDAGYEPAAIAGLRKAGVIA